MGTACCKYTPKDEQALNVEKKDSNIKPITSNRPLTSGKNGSISQNKESANANKPKPDNDDENQGEIEAKLS